MNTLNEIYRYTRLVFIRWKSIVTTIIFLILTIPTVIGLVGGNAVLATWVWIVLLFLDLHIAGFQVYHEVVKKLPKPAELSITCRLARVQASAFSEMPLSPIRFILNLDLVNRGEEPVTIIGLDIAKFAMNTDLIGQKPLNKKIIKTNLPHMHTGIHIPYTIEPSSRETNIVYEIEVGISNLDPVAFARRLNEFQRYEIDLQYQYEGLDRSVQSNTIQIGESFDDLKKSVIENWKARKRHDLIVEAAGI